MKQRPKRGLARWGARLRWARKSFANAAEIVRIGHLSTPYRTAYEVVHNDRVYSLRHYRGIERAGGDGLHTPVLLIPPLMVTSEIYDMSADVSAVSYLLGQGVDVWLADFGVPEAAEGGMRRTLDDHVLAVGDAVDRVRDATRSNVHLVGYSQGGMFAYQAAAYRGGEGIRSLITFGSPVDIRRILPVSEHVTERVIDGLRSLIERPLREIESLPGFLTSLGFKLLSPRKELQQVAEFVQKLHDRAALEKREARRRFLGGEGFVAWPGPALRTFIDEFIVANRMASGGFVVDGRTVSLADLEVPILSFFGLADDIARPAAVRAIKEAAFRADVYELGVPAGHLGLVVGSRALERTWPTVAAWLRWCEGKGALPAELAAREPEEVLADTDFDELELDVEDFYGFATDALQEGAKRLTRLGDDLSDTVAALRWQLPRLTKLRRIREDTRIGLGAALSDKARTTPDATFFLWRGRAFSYADADRRVSAIVRGLVQVGVRPGVRVGVLMASRPTYLSIVTALNRMGAVAVLLSPDMRRVGLERALTIASAEYLVCDPANAERGRSAWHGLTYALGGPYGDDRAIPEGVVDLEAIDPDDVALPEDLALDAGRASDEAMILFTAGRDDEPRAARITNRRWAVSALGAAAACTLEPTDTVYCVLPLHHAAGMLVAVGGALVGGARLALAPRFAPDHFWSEARRYGATVVFYAGEMCRPLVDRPPASDDEHNPVRLFAGSGMRRDVWERLRQRFKVGVLEFYASTEGNAVLANASGTKVGALGQPLPGATAMALVRYDFTQAGPVRDSDGRLERCATDEPGLLIARVDRGHAMAGFDGYVDSAASRERIIADAFEPGDRWFSSGDLLRQDADGDFWFVDRLADVVRTAETVVFTRHVEDVLYRRPDVRLVAVHGAETARNETVTAATVVARDGKLDLDRFAELVREKLRPEERPRFVCLVEGVPLTDGYRPLKRVLRERGLAGDVFERHEDGRYRPAGRGVTS